MRRSLLLPLCPVAAHPLRHGLSLGEGHSTRPGSPRARSSRSGEFRIQPNEGVSLRFAAKVPGRTVRLAEVKMDFSYADYFEAEPSTGYETLIYDCLMGDPTLFQRADNIEAGWTAMQPVLEAWTENSAADLHVYPAGSEGPSEADALLARDGRLWHAIV